MYIRNCLQNKQIILPQSKQQQGKYILYFGRGSIPRDKYVKTNKQTNKQTNKTNQDLAEAEDTEASIQHESWIPSMFKAQCQKPSHRGAGQ